MHTIVVGAGIVGLCTALSHAERGAKVTLIERGLPGAANSTSTGGGIREKFGTKLNITLSKLAAPFWATFGERFGVDICFRESGYLFIAKNNEEATRLKAQAELQNSLSVGTGRGIRGAAFRQQDGWANQHPIVDGLYRGVLEAGVNLQVGTEALSLISNNGGVVKGVVTTTGRMLGDAVVLATGPWCNSLLEPLGLTVPVAGHRHQLLIVEPAEPLPTDLPWLISVGAQVHLRPDSAGRVLVGGFLGHDERCDLQGWSRQADDDWSQEVLAVAGREFGVVNRDAVIKHGWAGLYPSTPDRHPVVDRLRPGLFGALGLSGTGLMHGPAIGVLMADLILDGSIDDPDLAKGLGLDRFIDTDGSSGEATGL
ncbi:hypothetical protein PRZ48_005548 [Zasmidium cellare]|uniref:FAD-dependent oxidoreductase domain-containing protein 1 n=1 Tax=Zasmidium cellare TaxID=395010 RepID=A0ABR0ELS8_ZASCE|nr:hypothetical protein PRZ48_005548 [Zasmidium cellare]